MVIQNDREIAIGFRDDDGTSWDVIIKTPHWNGAEVTVYKNGVAVDTIHGAEIAKAIVAEYFRPATPKTVEPTLLQHVARYRDAKEAFRYAFSKDGEPCIGQARILKITKEEAARRFKALPYEERRAAVIKAVKDRDDTIETARQEAVYNTEDWEAYGDTYRMAWQRYYTYLNALGESGTLYEYKLWE